MRHSTLLLLLLCLNCGLRAAQAQTPRGLGESSLTVYVADANGAAVIAAHVRVVSDAGKEWKAEADQRGEAFFKALPAGGYKIFVEASGFEPREVSEVSLKEGGNRVEVHLDVAAVKEEVNVTQDAREASTDPRGTAFTTILTGAQLAELPDDPEELGAVLREMAGPGAIIRVNGFSGGRLPPKSQIREIRFRLNPYAAENHDAGFVAVDIYTKPGLNTWHGTLNAGFRDESLNARPAFAPARGPEQYRRFGLALDGPLWRDHTSLFLSAEGNLSYDSQTVFAALPSGPFGESVPAPARTLDLSARVEHVLTKYHTLRAEYQRNALLQNNLGVGGFNLPERAYSRGYVENLLRASDSGPFGKRAVNELRLQARWQQTATRSASDTPAVLVLNAFNAGGSQLGGSRRVGGLGLEDNFDFALRKHSLRMGLSLDGEKFRSDELDNATGTFTFASLDAFRSGRPTTFTQRAGDPRVDFTQYQFGWYVQDDFRVTKSFSLNFGVRRETQNNVHGGNGFAPRAGFAWSPFADGKTTFRGGAGIFNQWLDDWAYEQTLRVDGIRQRELVVLHPGFPDPFSSGTELALAPSRIQLDKQLRLPYIFQGSLGVERSLTKSVLLRGSYFYQRGVHLFRGHNVNAPVPGVGRPDPTAGNVTQVESTANSSLHLFNLNLSPNHQRAGGRLFWVVNYSLSSAVNDTDGPLGLPANNFDLRAERGPAPEVARHRLFAIMNLRMFREWRLGAIFHASSGLPYNITTGFDNNGDTVSNDRPAGVGRNSARGAGNWDVSARLSWSFGFGSKVETTSPGGATVIRTGGGDDALGALSSRGVNRRWRAQTYLQVFNLFNHFNPTTYAGVETSPFFGQPTAALPGRRVEAGIRLSF
jgi:Carboxypeptidase regulatory-like domain